MKLLRVVPEIRGDNQYHLSIRDGATLRRTHCKLRLEERFKIRDCSYRSKTHRSLFELADPGPWLGRFNLASHDFGGRHTTGIKRGPARPIGRGIRGHSDCQCRDDHYPSCHAWPPSHPILAVPKQWGARWVNRTRCRDAPPKRHAVQFTPENHRRRAWSRPSTRSTPSEKPAPPSFYRKSTRAGRCCRRSMMMAGFPAARWSGQP